MKKGNSAYFKHILDAISRIEEYIRGISYEDFMNNHADGHKFSRQTWKSGYPKGAKGKAWLEG